MSVLDWIFNELSPFGRQEMSVLTKLSFGLLRERNEMIIKRAFQKTCIHTTPRSVQPVQRSHLCSPFQYVDQRPTNLGDLKRFCGRSSVSMAQIRLTLDPQEPQPFHHASTCGNVREIL